MYTSVCVLCLLNQHNLEATFIGRYPLEALSHLVFCLSQQAHLSMTTCLRMYRMEKACLGVVEAYCIYTIITTSILLCTSDSEPWVGFGRNKSMTSHTPLLQSALQSTCSESDPCVTSGAKPYNLLQCWASSVCVCVRTKSASPLTERLCDVSSTVGPFLLYFTCQSELVNAAYAAVCLV